MKRLTSILLAMLLLISHLSVPVFSDSKSFVTSKPASSKIFVNGVQVSANAYNINGNNYFKLRDLAMMLTGLNKQFEVTWDGTKNAINLITNTPYTSVGGELTLEDGTDQKAYVSNTDIYVDGVKVNLTAYSIKGNNYFSLRDIMKVLDVGVAWNTENNAIEIDTTVGNMDPAVIKGRIDFRPGAYYVGYILNGQPHVRGTANWDGNVFEGTFMNGTPISGRWTYNNGNVYEGEVDSQWTPTGNGKWLTAQDKYVQQELREAKGTPGDGTRKINVMWKPSTELFLALGRLGYSDRRLLDVNNSITRKFDTYFKNYKNHSAVSTMREMTEGKANIVFYQNMSAYDSDLSLDIKSPFNTFTALQNYPKDKLEDLRSEALKFAADTEFDKFLAENKDKYDKMVELTNKKLIRNYIVDLEKYFGSHFEEYKLIISPLQFGGYGQEIIVNDTLVPAIIIGWKDDFPQDSFDYVVYHECIHNFVKKVISKHRDEIQNRHGKLVDKVPLTTRDGDWYDNFNEQLTHALSLRFIKNYYGKAYADAYARRDVQAGWNFTEDFYYLLEKYEKNRDKYKNFDDFLPEIMNTLDTKL